MIRLAFCAAFSMANAAMAQDYCGLTADQVKALPQVLKDGWDGTFRAGIVVQDGKPQVLPDDGSEPQSITLTGKDGKLALVGDAFFPTVSFELTVEAADFALPGESALMAAELLAPQVAEFAIGCDPASLPQFQATFPMDEGATSTFRIFALSTDQLVLVIQGKGKDQAARAVFDLHRAGHS